MLRRLEGFLAIINYFDSGQMQPEDDVDEIMFSFE